MFFIKYKNLKICIFNYLLILLLILLKLFIDKQNHYLTGFLSFIIFRFFTL